PKARHNALSHSGAIAVIAPDRLVIAIGALRHIDRRAVLIARSTRCTNSGHSARPRWSYQSQIVRLIHDVKVFLQITYLPSMTYSHVIKFVYKGRRFSHLLPVHYQLQLHHFFNTITSPAFNSSSILTKPPSRNSSSSSLSRDPHLDYSSSFPLPQITF
ncbi:hypothetical protein L249_7404, partial [Ophiocordyceps polyrhachis-furcata BCC 54312]